jgi:type IV pilus assembly protein PilQ
LEVPFTGFPGINGGRGSFARPIAPVSGDPTAVGITQYDPTDLTAIDFTDPRFRDNPALVAVESTLGSIETGLFPFILYPQQFLARLRAEVVSGTGKILTDPTLVVQEGETASVELVEQIVQSIDVTTSDTVAGPRTTRDPQFAPVGLTLEVQVERIDDNGFVTLQVNPEISAPGDRVNTGEDGGFATEIVSRKVTSGRIRLRDSQTLIISGIIQERERSTVSKIPILGDLPIVGSLFRSTQRDNERAEVIVLVTPQIMDDSDRSNWGYRYNPSPDAMQMMDRGQPIPRR